MTIGILALYAVVSIAIAFGNEYKISPVSSGLAGLLAFILLTNAGTVSSAAVATINDASLIQDGVWTGAKFTALNVSNWGGGGLIVAMIAGLGAVYVIHLCYKYNLRIKLPDSVPPAIGNSFSSLIPVAIIAFFCWLVKSVLSFDLADTITKSLMPILGAADNIFTYGFLNFLKACLWSVGLHGDNIVGAVTSAITTVWTNENMIAGMAGEAIPHVWAGSINRLDMWVSSVWPILVYLLTSKKLKHMHPFAIACTPSAIFGIVEPVMYGLPIVLNPYFMISMILTHTITAFVTYGAIAAGIVGRFYISVVWCMPAPLIGLLATGGDIMGVVLVAVNFVIGMVITYPFFKAYEKSEVAKMETAEA